MASEFLARTKVSFVKTAVLSSNDGGNTWITIENSTESNNYWLFKQFLITEFIDLTDQVQFRFIAEDIFHEGDVGSGGSLVEAGLDDFLIEVFEENNSSCTLGDLNEDLAINVVDVVTMVSLIINLDNEQLNDYLCSGDLNGDFKEDLNLDGDFQKYPSYRYGHFRKYASYREGDLF